jgi:hypothetical protein
MKIRISFIITNGMLVNHACGFYVPKSFFCLAAKIFVSTSFESARCASFLLQMPSHHDDFAAKDPSN